MGLIEIIKKNKKRIYEVLTGLIAGICNGLFGGGGGMIVVPMLEKLLDKKTKTAHATAILIILPMSILSALIYSANYSVRAGEVIPVCVGVTAGGVLGALLLKKMSSKILVVIFSVLMAGAGVKLLFF